MAALIQKPMRCKAQLSEMSLTNLQKNIPWRFPGFVWIWIIREDYAVLMTIDETVFNLNEIMLHINTAEQVATGSDQVSSGAQALAAGSTEQAASYRWKSLPPLGIPLQNKRKENLTEVATAAKAIAR